MDAPQIVAILNVTPDSFSDGGTVSATEIMRKAERLIHEGADVLDVGAESTRPDATALSAQEEWARLEPVWAPLRELCCGHNVMLSLDSYHPDTVRAALEIGCDWINDVTGFEQESMLEAVRESSCKLVAMHSLGIPVDKTRHLPEECDVVATMREWVGQTIERAKRAGVEASRLVIDPGLGFGKTAIQSLKLMQNVREWRAENVPVLIGHSRKSFLSLFTQKPASERDCLTRLCSATLAAQQVEYLRVHEVAGHKAMFGAL